MRHRVGGKKLGRTTAHKKAMFRNMVTSLILNDRIETTLPKAKELKRWGDRMITLAKKNSVHAKREAMKVLKDKAALQKLFSTLVDRFNDRAGGYTRILKLGNRHGDNAAMAIVEYLTAEVKKITKTDTPKKATKKAAAQKPAKKAAPKAKKAAPAKGTKKPAAKSATKKTATKKKSTKKEDK